MRRILQTCVIFLAMLFCNPIRAEVRNIQDNYKLIYTILDSTGTPVTSQVPSVKIQKVSNSQWLDFDDLAFKASGWGNKSIALNEDTDEDLYYYVFNPPVSESTAEQYALLIENTNATYKDHQIELVNYQVIGNGTSTLTASDNIGINWADISNPTTAQNLSGTNFAVNQAIASVSGAVGSVTGGVTVTTNNDKTGYTVSTVSDKTGYSLSATQAFNLTGSITGNLSGSIGSLTTWDKTGYALSAAGIDSIWDEVQTGHTTPLSFGLYLDSKVSEAGGGGLTVQGIVDGVWDEILGNHTTTNTTGKKLSEMPTQYDIGP